MGHHGWTRARIPHSHREHRQHEARKADGDHGRSPAIGRLQPSAQPYAEYASERDARGEHSHGHGPSAKRKVDRDERLGRAAEGG
jgi:hypothetical protein